jgi:hypothetical protein
MDFAETNEYTTLFTLPSIYRDKYKKENQNVSYKKKDKIPN